LAQDNIIPTRYSNPLPQAPNVESLGKYGDVPVGHYTGVIDINIPFYTIKIKDYELPISISYHPSGIKVAEEASFIGLGWAFKGGGVISPQ